MYPLPLQAAVEDSDAHPAHSAAVWWDCPASFLCSLSSAGQVPAQPTPHHLSIKNEDVKSKALKYLFKKGYIGTALTVSHVSQLRYELVFLAVLSSWHQALIVRRVRIPVDIHQKGWGHEVWCLLRLLVQHIVVRVADKRSVVRMEKHLVRDLEAIKSMCMLRIWERSI